MAMRPRLSAAQFGVLQSLLDHGPVNGTEVLLPPAMDGSRRVKLECHLLNAVTLSKLESLGLVWVYRDVHERPKDATGRPGNPRRKITISIRDDGIKALSAQSAGGDAERDRATAQPPRAPAGSPQGSRGAPTKDSQ